MDGLILLSGWKEVYESVVEYISHQNAWGTSGRGIIERWNQGIY